MDDNYEDLIRQSRDFKNVKKDRFMDASKDRLLKIGRRT